MPLLFRCNPVLLVWSIGSIFSWSMTSICRFKQCFLRESFTIDAFLLKRSLRGTIHEILTGIPFFLIILATEIMLLERPRDSSAENCQCSCLSWRICPLPNIFGFTSCPEFRVDELTSCEREKFCWTWVAWRDRRKWIDCSSRDLLLYVPAKCSCALDSWANISQYSSEEVYRKPECSFPGCKRSYRKRRCLCFCIPSGKVQCSRYWDDCETKKYFSYSSHRWEWISS